MTLARDIANLFSTANGANGFVKLDGSSNLPAVNGASLTGIQGVNTGLIMPYGKDEVPTGFLACDGANVSRTTYADLFGVIGTTWGAGDGSTTFGLPDLQDNVVVGKSASKAHASSMGSSNVTPSGSVSVSVSVQNHTLSTGRMPSHSHRIGNSRSGANQGMVVNNINQHGDGNYKNYIGGGRYSQNTGSSQAHSHGGTGSGSFSGNSMSVLQPYVAVKYIIKT